MALRLRVATVFLLVSIGVCTRRTQPLPLRPTPTFARAPPTRSLVETRRWDAASRATRCADAAVTHMRVVETAEAPRRQALLAGVATSLGVPFGLAERANAAEAGASSVLPMNSYTERAGVGGQSNRDVAKYVQLGDGLRSQLVYKPKDFAEKTAVKNGDRVTVDLIGYLTGWNGVVFVRTQDKSGYSEKPLSFKVGAGEAIPGLDRGVVGMVQGEKRRLVIPPSLGYPRPCKEDDLGKPGAIPNPMDSAEGSGAPWELRNRLLNGVLNNARDDTLVIDVKMVRVVA